MLFMENFIIESLNKIKYKLSKNLEINKIFIDLGNDGNNYFFEILLNDRCWNERDIDFIDIEITYKMLNLNQIDLKGEFYAGDGNIYDSFHIIDKVNAAKDQLSGFLDRILIMYDNIVKLYIK